MKTGTALILLSTVIFAIGLTGCGRSAYSSSQTAADGTEAVFSEEEMMALADFE